MDVASGISAKIRQIQLRCCHRHVLVEHVGEFSLRTVLIPPGIQFPMLIHPHYQQHLGLLDSAGLGGSGDAVLGMVAQ